MSPQLAAGLTALVGICMVAGWLAAFRNRAYLGLLGLGFLAISGFLLSLANARAAEDLEIYYRELRDDCAFYVNPCAGMPVQRIVEITGGQRVVIVADLEEPPSIR